MSPNSDGIVVAVDQGTSSTKAIGVSTAGDIIAAATVPIGQRHPRPGWVEQDATEIVDSVRRCLTTILQETGRPVAAIGLSTQRESAIAWERDTAEPLGPVLGWQDRRTAGRAGELGHAAPGIEAVTGLPLDPMFSALKFEWLLNEIDPDRSRASAGEICLGTVDAYLVYALTGEHRIEIGNASRTQLLDVRSGQWDESLCDLFGVPLAALPAVVASNEPGGPIVGIDALGTDAVINAVLADSHAALYAHGADHPSAVKATYGTGSSVMGLAAPIETGALVRTIAWGMPEPVTATEGNILSSGSTLVWLASILGVSVDELAALATEASFDHGVDLVPAFAGLGAPYWDEAAVATLRGVNLGTDRATIARAGMESIALQIEDVLAAMEASTGPLDAVRVDGGATRNDWLMQLQADLSQRTIIRSDTEEMSALGAARLAAQSAGVWNPASSIPSTTFTPKVDPDRAAVRRERWATAVAAARLRNSSECPKGTN